MKRVAVAAGLLVLFAVPDRADARATFDAAANGLRLGGDALRAYDFESAESLVGLELASWVRGGGFPSLERTRIAKAEDVADMLTGAADAIEGSHALRLSERGLAIVDEALFAQVAKGKLEVTLWARADGAAPSVQVLYDADPENVFAGRSQFAAVRAVRTGRQTTDGWVEMSTGPIDGSVWGVPLRAVVVLPSYYADAESSFLVDALEIRKVEGKPVAPLSCTQQTVDAVCGAEGDCMFGHCVSSTVTWGVLPSRAHRAEIAERWIQFGTRFIGDRNSAKKGVEILTPGARALAETAVSSRQFYGGMNRLVNLLRDNHTSFGSPANWTSFSPQVQQGSSSALGACFGVVEKDLLGGGLGYAVFRAGQDPLTGVPLKRGDVLFAIDGQDPKQWVDEMWPRFATTLPNDPESDWGSSANDLSRLIATRASTVTLIRCASTNACGEGSRETITIDVASAVFKAVTGQVQSAGQAFGCSQRFLDFVAELGQGQWGEDTVSTSIGAGGETRVQFDGFVGQGGWESAMSNVFAPRPAKVLMDARMGHGGYYTTVEHLFHLLRGTSEPIGVLSMGRGTYDMTDPPWLFQRLGSCVNDQGDLWSCFAGNANGFFSKQADPPGAATKIAWLNTRDVSANDFMPKLLAGRSNFHIFAPHPTSGAFGAVSSLPGVAPGWSGGSLQIQDARFATDVASASSARWESGHGVPPDTVVVQKLSDALAGTDTLVKVATEWLAAP